MISARLWRSHFGSDPAVLGRSITLNGRAATIVGVVETFRGLVAETPADVFAPLDAGAAIDPVTVSTMIRLVARLPPDVPVRVAEEKLASLYQSTGARVCCAPGELQIELPPGSRGVSAIFAAPLNGRSGWG